MWKIMKKEYKMDVLEIIVTVLMALVISSAASTDIFAGPKTFPPSTFDGEILYVGGNGNVKVEGIHGGTVVFVDVPAGKWLDRVRFKKVYATGTTATGIVVAYR